MLQKYKKIIGVILGVLILFVLYAIFFKKEAEAPLSSSVPASSIAGDEGELLMLLSQLEDITLDGTFFSDPLFTSLTDFTVNFALEPRQRPNPFAPIGSDGILPAAQQGTSSVDVSVINFEDTDL